MPLTIQFAYAIEAPLTQISAARPTSGLAKPLITASITHKKALGAATFALAVWLKPGLVALALAPSTYLYGSLICFAANVRTISLRLCRTAIAARH